MRELKEHNNIVQVYDHQWKGICSEYYSAENLFFLTKELSYIVMEFHPNGDLFSLIESTGKFTPEFSRYMFLQLLDTVEYLHESAEIAHLDLKLENVLIGNDMKIKICDFGFS